MYVCILIRNILLEWLNPRDGRDARGLVIVGEGGKVRARRGGRNHTDTLELFLQHFANTIYDIHKANMHLSFFSEAATFIEDTMNACAYARRLATDLRGMETRYNESNMSASDLFLLKNLTVIIQCAVEDHEWGDELPGTQAHELRRKKAAFDRNCVQKEAHAVQLRAQLHAIIEQVETQLAAQNLDSPQAAQGHLRIRITEARDQAHTLEQSLAAILGETGDASRPRKRTLGSVAVGVDGGVAGGPLRRDAKLVGLLGAFKRLEWD